MDPLLAHAEFWSDEEIRERTELIADILKGNPIVGLAAYEFRNRALDIDGGGMARERRWIVLAENGDHSTVGRHTDPDSELLDTVTGQLRRQNVGGWLAVLEGDYYGRGALSLLMVRELAPAVRNWGDAEAAFLKIRAAAV